MNLLRLIDLIAWIGLFSSIGVLLGELTVKQAIPHYVERLTEKQMKKKRLTLGSLVLFFLFVIALFKYY